MEKRELTVEVLFPEVCNCFGDPKNAEYLKLTLPDAHIIETPLDGEPVFVTEKPDIILIGSMSERTQRACASKLLPFADRISLLADSGTVILATGSASDLFGKRIGYLTENKSAEGLGIFDFETDVDWFRRVNAKTIGSFEGITVTGFRSQFSLQKGDNSGCAFLAVERGPGLCEGSRFEGWRRGGLIATQLLGPLLPLNPLLCEYLLCGLGFPVRAAFREEALAAYEKRIAEFRDRDTKF